jgi:tetratricopeptide (TPR) repeat protein
MAALAVAAGQGQNEKVPLYDGLGDHHYEITTNVPLAQKYFDQGLRLSYAFNHPEAIRSFEEAARLDPACAMCWWGVALALGPNINAPMDAAAGAEAHAAIMKAMERLDGTSAKEQAYIRALAKRYAATAAAQNPSRDSAYARAMGDVVRRMPGDDDAVVLWADALMNLTPWDYWVPSDEAKRGTATKPGTVWKPGGSQPRPHMVDAIESLQKVLERSPDHAGACHFFIHAVEEAYPERAIACAERLPTLMPGAGHIAHMPGHIYIRVGRYNDAIERNIHAAHADNAILEDIAPDGIYRIGYVPHNHHFLWFAATMAGRTEMALDAARQTASMATKELAALLPVQQFLITPLFADVRFERWDAILASPAPEPGDYTKGVWHYARAIALAGKGRIAEAKQEHAKLRELRAKGSLGDGLVGFNSPASILEIADAVVEGEIAAREQRWDTAIAALRRGVELEDLQTYGEPPDWHVPVRHNLGAVLLAADRPAEAESAFREDLDRFPENGWSLLGLARSLEAQNRNGAARELYERFEKAFADADAARTLMRYRPAS